MSYTTARGKRGSRRRRLGRPSSIRAAAHVRPGLGEVEHVALRSPRRPDRGTGCHRAAGDRACQADVVTVLPDSARVLIESGAIAHCTTLNADGSPQVSAVWIGLEGSDDDTEIVMAHLSEHHKVRNLRRDPRIAFSCESAEENGIGMRYNLVLYGTATITDGGAAELLRRLGWIYTGREFPLPADPPPGYVVRVRVDRIAGVGPWST